ncbi:hypothetical protein NPIL_265211 [Nephila pilipes]|uniref:Uncharacterized protein n=1 Tax=Nephila pilipes TaxID=299642 RepID=A0A8X6PBC5_NEPPI|nr:hypothetical protein NPIL_265211 [Nephila pilipes]
MAADGQRIIHRRLSRDYSDSSDDSDDNASVKKSPATSSMTGANQVTSTKVPEKNGLVLKPSLSLEPYDVAFKRNSDNGSRTVESKHMSTGFKCGYTSGAEEKATDENRR